MRDFFVVGAKGFRNTVGKFINLFLFVACVFIKLIHEVVTIKDRLDAFVGDDVVERAIAFCGFVRKLHVGDEGLFALGVFVDDISDKLHDVDDAFVVINVVCFLAIKASERIVGFSWF